MNFTATGNLTFNESRIETLNLSGDEQFLTDLFNILSNQAGKDVQFEGSTYRPVNQLKDAINQIKSGEYRIAPYRKEAMSADTVAAPQMAETVNPLYTLYVCPKCHGQSNGTFCRQCRSGEVETRVAQGPSTPRTYTHTCHNCHCQCSISNVGPTLRDCPECGTTDMIRTMDVNL